MALMQINGVVRLTRNPEIKFLPGKDIAVAQFGVACSTKYNDKEQTCFIECVVFGKRAEAVGNYLYKGSKVFIRGILQQDVWETDSGKRSKHKVLVEQIEFCEGRKDTGYSNSSNEDTQSAFDEDD